MLDAQKKLGQVVQDASGEGIVVFTSNVFQVAVSFVVEHLVGGQIHGGIQELKQHH